MDKVPGFGGLHSENLTMKCGQGSDGRGAVQGFMGAHVGAHPDGAGLGLM